MEPAGPAGRENPEPVMAPPDWSPLLAELVPADALAAAPADPAARLDFLVKAGRLTAYQAGKLRRGEGRALVVGPYRLLCPLARGGMGMVYLGTGPAGGAVAVKVLSPSRAAREPHLRGRFHREQAVGDHLPAHPHLVRQLDYGISGGVEFLVLNHLPGRTVRQLLGAGPLAVGVACRVFADAAAGLAAAHAAGVVHRDLKPSNVMVGPTGRGTVLDFGLALLPGDQALPQPAGGVRVTLGTLDYMPPEQVADAGRVGPPADLYALGGGLFTALTAQLVFDAVGMEAKLRALRREVPPLVTVHRPEVPPPLAFLVARLLAKHPAERPTAAEAAAELRKWADRTAGDPVPDRRPLAEVVAAAEAEWAGRTGGADRSPTQTVAATLPRQVRLSRRQAAGLAAGAAAVAGLAAWAGRRVR